jgi:hypothetical protein
MVILEIDEILGTGAKVYVSDNLATQCEYKVDTGDWVIVNPTCVVDLIGLSPDIEYLVSARSLVGGVYSEVDTKKVYIPLL